MGSQTALLLGVGANPGALNMDEELRRFEWKVKAGRRVRGDAAGFRLDLLEEFLKAIRAHYGLPVIAGIWPLTSYPQRRIHGERAARAGAGSLHGAHAAGGKRGGGAGQEGVAIAREMVENVRKLVQGVQFSAPFGRYPMAIEVAEAIGPKE